MHFYFTGLVVFLMSSQKVMPREALCKAVTDISCFLLCILRYPTILTNLNIAGNNNRLRAIKSRIKSLLPTDIPHIMEIFYNASHL